MIAALAGENGGAKRPSGASVSVARREGAQAVNNHKSKATNPIPTH
jgi:hypothetical protein